MCNLNDDDKQHIVNVLVGSQNFYIKNIVAFLRPQNM